MDLGSLPQWLSRQSASLVRTRPRVQISPEASRENFILTRFFLMFHNPLSGSFLSSKKKSNPWIGNVYIANDTLMFIRKMMCDFFPIRCQIKKSYLSTSVTAIPPNLSAKMLYRNAMMAPQINAMIAKMIGNRMILMRPNASRPNSSCLIPIITPRIAKNIP